MARCARRAIAVSVLAAGLFFGLSATAWGAESHDDKQQIQVGDTTPGGASPTGSTTGRDAGRAAEAADPSGLMGEATGATRNALASLGGAPSDSVATSERSGAESQAATGSRNPRVPIVDPAVADTAESVADAVRMAPATVDRIADTTATGGPGEVTTPVDDAVDTTESRIETVVSSSAQAVDTVRHEAVEAVCGATGARLCMPVPMPLPTPVPDTGDGLPGDGLPGIEDGATTPPVAAGNTAETPGNGDALPVLLGGIAFPMPLRGSDAPALQGTQRASVEENRSAHPGGLDQPVPTDEPRPAGPEGNGPGQVVGGAAQPVSTLVDVRLPDAHHAAAGSSDAWRLPGSVTLEPGHSPD